MLGRTGCAEAFECESPAIFPSLYGAAIGEMFVNPDEPVNRLLQSKAILVRAVIAIENTRVAFGRENVGIRKHFVSNDGPANAAAIRIVVLDECDSAERIDAREPGVVERAHVHGVRIVAHGLEQEMEGEVEGTGAMLHCVGPLLDEGD